MFKISLLLSAENDWYPCVIFFKPILLNKFSNGKNSPNGTSLFLFYLYNNSDSLFNTTKEL